MQSLRLVLQHGYLFFLERPGQLPACINKEKAFYMKNLLRKVLNRRSIGKLPTEKKAKEITRYLDSQLKRLGILHPPGTTILLHSSDGGGTQQLY